MKFVIEIEMEKEIELADQYSAAADILLAIDGVAIHKFNVVSAKFDEAKAKWNNHPPGCRDTIDTAPRTGILINEQRDGTGTSTGRTRSAVPDIHNSE